MPNEEYARAAHFEHLFWLQIMGDHARFLMQMIPVGNHDDIQRAYQFRSLYDQLLEQVRKSPPEDILSNLTEEALQATLNFRTFKLYLLAKGLEGKLHIATTFLSHMVNELEEYLRIINSLQSGKVPPVGNPLHYHLLWLLDGVGHAAAIAGSLDMIEKKLINKSREFQNAFENMYLKAVELAGYLRTGMERFPALSRFNQEAALEMKIFKSFLEEILKLELNGELLGELMPLMADHMVREECYYLLKLAQSAHIKTEECDPIKPRIE